AIAVARRSDDDGVDFESRPPERQTPLVLAAVSWVGAAFLLWIVSRVARPLFLPRYLIPLAPAYAVVGTVALQAAMARARRFARANVERHRPAPPAASYVWVLAIAIAVALYEPIWRADSLPAATMPAADSLEMRFDLPIATLSTNTYLPREWYA